MNDYFVGGLALVIAALSAASAFGWTDAAYQLGSIQAIQRRFGDRGRWLFFVLITLVMLASGAAILLGFRPL